MIHPMTYAGLEKAPTIGASSSYERIINHAACIFDVEVEDILGQTRKREVVDARHAAMYCAKLLKGDSYQRISEVFNRKEHSSVIHAVKKISDLRKMDKKLDAKVRNLLAY